MYVVGQGDSGQLGLGPHTRYSPQPTCIPLPHEEFNFIFIAAGIAHSGKRLCDSISHFTLSLSPQFYSQNVVKCLHLVLAQQVSLVTEEQKT